MKRFRISDMGAGDLTEKLMVYVRMSLDKCSIPRSGRGQALTHRSFLRGLMLMAIPLSIATIIACGNTGVDNPGEPTEQDAIYDIIRYDMPEVFNLDLIDSTTGDTSLMIQSEYLVGHFWRKINKDSLFIDIALNNPPPDDTVGAVPWADVIVKRFFWGTLEVMAIDTTGGGSLPVRFSKPFAFEGDIDARFDRVGMPSNSRRGWRLSWISDGVSSHYSSYINRIEITPANYPDSIIYAPAFNVSVLTDNNVPEYARGDSVTLRIYINSNLSDPRYYVTLKYTTDNGAAFRRLGPDSSGVYVTGFRFSNSTGYGKFMVDLVSNQAVTSDAHLNDYIPVGVSVLYRLPWTAGKMELN
jgi:hypothetical protein